MKKGINVETVRELVLFATNDGDIYRSQTTSIIKSLAKKMKRGVYDHEKATKAFEYMADTAAKKYFKEFCMGGNWYTIFPKAERTATAKELADYYIEEIEYFANEERTVAAV